MPLEVDPQITAAMRPAVPGAQPPVAGDWKTRRDGAEADFAHINSLRPAVPDVTTTDHRVPSSGGDEILLRWYVKKPGPSPATPGPAALYLHGGSMILASVELYDTVIRNYVSTSGVPMLAVDYRLAPENPYPAQLDDCWTGLTWLAGHAAELGVDPARIAVIGDSAGGALAAGLTLLARDRQGPAIARQLLIYPMLDDRPSAPDPALALVSYTGDDNVTGWTALLGEATGGPDVPPYAAPARALDVTGLPPLYLDVGQVDILADQDVEYARRISATGTPVELHVHPGAVHAFEMYAPDADVSRRAMADRVRVLRSL